MVIVVVISPIISFMLVVVLIVDRIATSLTAKTTVLGMVMSSASYALVVLTQDEKEGFLNFVPLHVGRLGGHQLLLLFAKASSSEQMPSLDLWWKCHIMVSQLAVEVVVLGRVLQEGLTRSPLELAEVPVEAIRKLDRPVILKGFVQRLQHLLKGSRFLDLVDGKVLKELPCCASEASDDAQESFRFSFGDPHLHHIDGDPLPPFLVVGGCTAEQRDVGVLRGVVVSGGTRRSSSSRHCLRQWRGCRPGSTPGSQSPGT